MISFGKLKSSLIMLLGETKDVRLSNINSVAMTLTISLKKICKLLNIKTPKYPLRILISVISKFSPQSFHFELTDYVNYQIYNRTSDSNLLKFINRELFAQEKEKNQELCWKDVIYTRISCKGLVQLARDFLRAIRYRDCLGI